MLGLCYSSSHRQLGCGGISWFAFARNIYELNSCNFIDCDVVFEYVNFGGGFDILLPIACPHLCKGKCSHFNSQILYLFMHLLVEMVQWLLHNSIIWVSNMTKREKGSIHLPWVWSSTWLSIAIVVRLSRPTSTNTFEGLCYALFM